MNMPYCKTAWVIDDEEMSVFYTEHFLYLNKFSAEVRSFLSAKEALAQLETLVEQESFPDFIFLDINMPVLDGWGFLQACQELPKAGMKKCAVYILSSSVDEDDIAKSKKQEGVRGFLSKPLEKNELEAIKVQMAEFSPTLH